MGKRTAEEQQTRWQRITVVLMFLAYGSMMIAKVAFTALSPAMTSDPRLGMTTTKYGRIVAWNAIGSVVGKAATGLGADRLGGKKMLLLAMVFLALITALFGVTHLHYFALLNFLTMFFRAGGWPAMAKIVRNWIPKSKHGRAWSIISMSSRVGTVTGGLLVGWLLLTVSWRVVFMVSAAPAMLVAVIIFLVLKERPKEKGLTLPLESNHNAAKPSQPHALDATSVAQACLAFVRSPRVLLMALSIFLLSILMDFIGFLPLYFKNVLLFEDDTAGTVGTVIFPAGMFVALFLCSLGYDWLSKKQLTRVIGALLAVACFCIAILWKLPTFELSSDGRAAVSMTTIFVLGFSLSPAYYIPMSVFSLDFGGKHSGLLISLLDICGYVGSFIFFYFGGEIVDDHGWPAFLFLLLLAGGLSLVSMTSFLRLDAAAEKT